MTYNTIIVTTAAERRRKKSLYDNSTQGKGIGTLDLSPGSSDAPTVCDSQTVLRACFRFKFPNAKEEKKKKP